MAFARARSDWRAGLELMHAGNLDSVVVGLRDENDLARPVLRRLNCQYAAKRIERWPEEQQFVGIQYRRETALRNLRESGRELIERHRRTRFRRPSENKLQWRSE